VETKAYSVFLPTGGLPVFHVMKFVDTTTGETLDAAYAKPPQEDRQGRFVPARFDTVLVNISDSENATIQGNNSFYK
jgi:hypothetical protein